MRRAAIHIQARRSAAAPELTQRQRGGAVEYSNYCALLASSGELAAIVSESKGSKLVVVSSDQRRLTLAEQLNANLAQRGGMGGQQAAARAHLALGRAGTGHHRIFGTRAEATQTAGVGRSVNL